MGRKQKRVGELVMTRVFQIYIMEIINRLSTFCTLLQLSNTEHFLHPLLVFISIPTADTQIRFGSVALYQHFHTLIFVHTVSCSTRKWFTCTENMCGLPKAKFHSSDFASGYICSVFRHEMVYIYLCMS